AFAEAIGVRHCIGVANGTDALFVALKMLGIGPGDHVITAANSWIASSEVASLCGATPIFADVDAETFNIDLDRLGEYVTPQTRAIVPVHLYGNPLDMDRLTEFAAHRDIAIVEDCAQAHLATFGGRTVGTFGQAAGFSFYPGKNLGAYGDA